MQHKTALKTTNLSLKSEGNALIIILVVIALLAALTAVAMRSSNRSTGNMDSETARISAEKLLRQAKSIESGVAKLLTVNRCSENDISFQNATTTRDYTNSNSPADKSCHLYELSGAGLSYTEPNPAAIDGALSTLSDHGEWVFTADHCVLEIGSDDNDTCVDEEIALIAIAPHINLQTCLAVNDLLGISNPSGAPPTESYDETSTTFAGTFAAASDPELGEGASGASLKRHSSGCFKNTSGSWNNSYIFYQVLLAR